MVRRVCPVGVGSGFPEYLTARARLFDAIHRGRPVLLLLRPWDFMSSQYLLANQVSADTPVIIYENLTLPDERLFQGRLREVGGLRFSDLTIVIIGCELGSNGKTR